MEPAQILQAVAYGLMALVQLLNAALAVRRWRKEK